MLPRYVDRIDDLIADRTVDLTDCPKDGCSNSFAVNIRDKHYTVDTAYCYYNRNQSCSHTLDDLMGIRNCDTYHAAVVDMAVPADAKTEWISQTIYLFSVRVR